MNAWIFDLDGVVTNLEAKTITNPLILYSMIKLLQHNEPVIINTGRSLVFIHQEILTPLLNKLKEQNLPESLLHNFFAVGEKGNVWIADEKDYFDTATAVPQDFAKKIQDFIESKYADTLLFDTGKKTMISIESHKGISLDKFTPLQHNLTPIFKQLMEDFRLTQTFKMDNSISAIDIEHNTAGKDKGIERIMEWLQKRQITPQEYIAFGDSVADLGMGEKLDELGVNFTFVFVGNPKRISIQPSFPITYTQELYDKGVIEYLKQLG